MVKFNAETHSYTLDGAPVPGVTRILEAVFRQFDGVQSDDLVRARNLGLAVHAATEYFDEGELDEASVHPDVRPGLDAWVTWRQVTGFVPLRIEALVGSRRFRYAGRLDRFGYFKAEASRPVVVDLKFVRDLSPATALQTAGYALAAEETFKGDALGFGGLPARRFAVKLRRDGKPFPKEYTDVADRAAFLAVASAAAWGWNSGVLRGGF